MNEYRALAITLTEDDIKRMTLTVENNWSNLPTYAGTPNELLSKTYSLVNVPKQVWEQLRDFMSPPLAEPKEFGAMVEAGVKGWSNRVPLVSVNGRWWSRNNLYFNWSELENPKRIKDSTKQ